MSGTATLDHPGARPDHGAAHKPARRGGRPTKAAAAERDERLLEIATRLFLDQGFDATSMDGVAEAAAIGKATLYARYADKAALFADVIRRRILQVYGPLEETYASAPPDTPLADFLYDVAHRLVTSSLSEDSVTLGRIMSAQGPRFPDLARLAITEGYGRQVRLIESIFARFKDDHRHALPDPHLAAELFLSLVLGPATRFKMYGLAIDPGQVERRTNAAVALFLRGTSAPQRS